MKIFQSKTIIGENKNTTIVKNKIQEDGCPINIIANNVNLVGFTVLNSTEHKPGILIEESENSTIDNCKVLLNYRGLSVKYSVNITISNCYFETTDIFLYNTHNSRVINCITTKGEGGGGIGLQESNYNTLIGCNVTNANSGITIYHHSSYNHVKYCNVSNSSGGINIYDASHYNYIEHCYISRIIRPGIWVFASYYNPSDEPSNNNIIEKNMIFDNYMSGIRIDESYNNTIYANSITENRYGIILEKSVNTTIYQNAILNNNKEGINLSNSNKTKITYNNFEENDPNAIFKDGFKNRWFRNYWDDKGYLFKAIFGQRTIKIGKMIEFPITWINFDWHPATEPYDIS